MVRYVREDGVLREFPLGSYSAYTDLMRNCAAIISKPGSDPERLAGIRNPFVMLEPFGDHELHNSAYWESRGFGIRFAEWKAGIFQNLNCRRFADVCWRSDQNQPLWEEHLCDRKQQLRLIN